METPLKTLIDKLRPKAEWQHPDPAVRAEAVLRLGAHEHDILLAVAREDGEARVRRAAIKKIALLPVLGERAREDPDESVREEAAGRIASLAIHGQEAASAEAAVGELRDARHLATVAKSAALVSVRLQAVARLADAKHLAAVVRDADDNPTRLAALARIEEPTVLVSLAANSAERAVALAAVERLTDRDSLLAVAAKARVSAAGRRARARADLLPQEAAAEAPAEAPPPDMGEVERLAYEQARAEQARETAERARLAEEREAEERRASREREAEEQQVSLARATEREAELQALCAQAEELAVSEDLAAARTGLAGIDAKWSASAATPEALTLRPRLDAARDRLRAREAQTREERVRVEKENLSRLQGMADRLERLAKAEGPSLRDVDHALREAREALDNPGALPSRRDRETVLPRLEAARKALYPTLQQLREDTEWKRWANVAVQEELCVKVEALREAKDLEKAAEELRDLDARWKQAREAPKEKGEALWNRFKAARDEVKARCDAWFAKQAAEQSAHLKVKQALCERAEALAESTDWLKTAEELKKLQVEWKASGPVARPQSEALWRRFRKPSDLFFARRKANQDQREKDWATNLAKKNDLCQQAEALQDSTAWEASSLELKRLQGEWKTVGSVRKNKSDAVWERFRKACDHFFERYKDRDNLERQAAVAAREALCAGLEAIVPADPSAAAEAPPDLAARVQEAQEGWRQAAEVSRESLTALTARFTGARNRLVELWPDAFQGTELDPEANRRKAEKLCDRVEAILIEVGPEATPTVADLAARLKNALAANTIGGQAAVQEKWQAAAAEIEAAEGAWQRIGPVPGDAGRALPARFEGAVRRFREMRPRVETPRAPAPDRRDRPDRRPRTDRPDRGRPRP